MVNERKSFLEEAGVKKISPLKHYPDSHSSDSELRGLISLQKSLLRFYL